MTNRCAAAVLASALCSVALGACPSSPPKPTPDPVTEEPTDPDEEPEEPERPIPEQTLAGDEQVPEKWRTHFRRWVAGDFGGVYQRVVRVSEVSNAISVLVMRQYENGGECRTGPSTLEIVEEGDEVRTDIEHFGDDCCPGTTCEPSNHSWMLRYLQAVETKDLAALAGLVPAKGKLSYHLVTGGEGAVSDTKRSFTRKDIAAGKLVNPPGCNFIETRPDCTQPDAATGAFQCSCHGGGYHVTYDWKKEGDTMVIVAIDESSS